MKKILIIFAIALILLFFSYYRHADFETKIEKYKSELLAINLEMAKIQKIGENLTDIKNILKRSEKKYNEAQIKQQIQRLLSQNHITSRIIDIITLSSSTSSINGIKLKPLDLKDVDTFVITLDLTCNCDLFVFNFLRELNQLLIVRILSLSMSRIDRSVKTYLILSVFVIKNY